MLREVNANVFKFNREKKCFERAKVNSRCFYWFPAAIFESLRGAPTWRPSGSRVSILNSIIFSDALSLRAGSHLGAHARVAKSEFKSEVML